MSSGDFVFQTFCVDTEWEREKDGQIRKRKKA